MGKPAFGTYDDFAGYEMAAAPRAADVYEHHIREVQRAEELGYQYYFVIEHQNSDVGQLTAPTVYLSAVAQRTQRIRFGVMIHQLPFYHPVRLAEEVAMLDHLSRGRFEFGTGIGVSEHEFMRWKLPFHERRQMSEEALEIILKCWTQEEVTFEGKYWQFDEALPVPKPYQQPHPPVWVAAHSPSALDFAARNNYHVSQNIDVDTVIAEKFAYYRRSWKACNHPGAMPRSFLTRAVHVAKTDAIAREQAEAALLASRRLTRERIAKTRIGFKGNDDSPSNREIARVFQGMSTSYDFWIENGLALVGSPQTVIRRMQAQHQLIDYDIFCANHHVGPIKAEHAANSMELFAKEVMPAFA